MINQRMYELGSEPSAIRELFAYGMARKAKIGDENVFDFSLGNPSIPAPAAVHDAIIDLMKLPPEQVHHALIEVFRRRGARSREDLRPKLRQRILKAYEASGLSPDEYVQRMHGKDEEVNQLTRDALAEASARAAREDALLRTFEASGKTLNEFADMYGLHILDANRSLERARARLAAKA